MAQYSIDQLIINSPLAEPSSYWAYHRQTRFFTRQQGRRPAGYVTATPGAKSFDDPGIFRELPLVNRIRPRVKAWREANYPGVTGITRRLLEHWQDPEERDYRRFFFCQLEAIETLIWLVEATPCREAGNRSPRRWRSVPAALLQDGHGDGQDDRDDHALRVADPQQGDRRGRTPGSPGTSSSWPRLDRAEPASGLDSRQPGELLRRIQHRARRAWSRSSARAGSWSTTGMS